MKLYVGKYWVPFPQSEYGGTWTVVAENGEQVHQLLKQFHVDNYYSSADGERLHNERLLLSILVAQVFELSDSTVHEAKVVDCFFT
jgi:hypothetical protein